MPHIFCRPLSAATRTVLVRYSYVPVPKSLYQYAALLCGVDTIFFIFSREFCFYSTHGTVLYRTVLYLESSGTENGLYRTVRRGTGMFVRYRSIRLFCHSCAGLCRTRTGYRSLHMERSPLIPAQKLFIAFG